LRQERVVANIGAIFCKLFARKYNLRGGKKEGEVRREGERGRGSIMLMAACFIGEFESSVYANGRPSGEEKLKKEDLWGKAL